MQAAAKQRHDAATALRARRLRTALGLNLVVVVTQVVVGVVAHSIGLLSDAGHNLTDVVALAASLYALRLAARTPTAQRSFGWHRGTILAAQANAAMILVLSAAIVIESIRRLGDPPEVDGALVLVVALVGFAVNAAAALVLRENHAGHDDGHGHAHGHDLNMRSAMLHLVSDAAASLGVAAAGAVILLSDGGWSWLDPAVSIAIAATIAWHAWMLLRSANAVLLEGTPEGIDPGVLAAEMASVDGVETVHDLHVWSLSSQRLALSAHVVVDGHPSLEEAQEIGGRVRRHLAGAGISHATLELECESCEEHGPTCDLTDVRVGNDPDRRVPPG